MQFGSGDLYRLCKCDVRGPLCDRYAVVGTREPHPVELSVNLGQYVRPRERRVALRGLVRGKPSDLGQHLSGQVIGPKRG